MAASSRRQREQLLPGSCSCHLRDTLLAAGLPAEAVKPMIDNVTALAMRGEPAASVREHLRLEELYIVPALRDRGRQDLVDRLLSDHAYFKAAIYLGVEGMTKDAVQAVRTAYHNHGQWEDREVLSALRQR